MYCCYCRNIGDALLLLSKYDTEVLAMVEHLEKLIKSVN